MNLVTREKVLQGVAEVKEGISFCLSLPLDYPGGAVLNPRRHPPRLAATLRDSGPLKGGQNFESPRFTIGAAGSAQDLGEIVVHPLDSGQQALQIYGVESPEEFARLFTLLPVPGSEPIAAARACRRVRHKGVLPVGAAEHGLQPRPISPHARPVVLDGRAGKPRAS